MHNLFKLINDVLNIRQIHLPSCAVAFSWWGDWVPQWPE